MVGFKASEFWLERGKTVGEEFSWYPSGQLRCYDRHDAPSLSRYWNEAGILIYERDDGAQTVKHWYGTGQLKCLRADQRAAYYAPQGALAFTEIKQANNTDFTITFEDAAMRDAYRAILGDFELDRYVLLWVRRTLESDRPRGVAIVLALLMDEDPMVKYDAILLARNQRVIEAVPLLQQALQDDRVPPTRTDPRTQRGRGVVLSVAQSARHALSVLRK